MTAAPTPNDTADRALREAMTPEESRSFLCALPGYPFLPCKICGFTGSCDHIGWERARARHPGLVGSIPARRS